MTGLYPLDPQRGGLYWLKNAKGGWLGFHWIVPRQHWLRYDYFSPDEMGKRGYSDPRYIPTPDEIDTTDCLEAKEESRVVSVSHPYYVTADGKLWHGQATMLNGIVWTRIAGPPADAAAKAVGELPHGIDVRAASRWVVIEVTEHRDQASRSIPKALGEADRLRATREAASALSMPFPAGSLEVLATEVRRLRALVAHAREAMGVGE